MVKNKDSKQKIIKLHIDNDTFPMLFNIKNEDLGDLCYNIFEAGYNEYFNNIKNKQDNNNNNNQQIIKALDYHTDSVKYDLEQVKNHLNILKIDDKMEKFSYILEELLGITNNSSKKGRLSENLIYKMLKTKFKNYTLDETSNTPHSGDAIMSIPNNNKVTKVLVEIKNYTRNVNTEELEKLIYDMKYTEIKYSLIISLQSGFVGKQQLSIQEFNHNGQIYTIVYIPNVFDEINKIEAGVLLIERLINHSRKVNVGKLQIKWLENNIEDNLRQLDDVYTHFTMLKQQYIKMENNIRQNMDEYFINLRHHEIDVKDKINRIWNNITTDLGYAEKELIANKKMDTIIKSLKSKNNTSNKNLVDIFEFLKKYEYKVKQIQYDKLWHISNKDNNCGIILRTPKNINLTMDHPEICLDITTKSRNIKKELNLLEKILNK
jgi:hypothetical protein